MKSALLTLLVFPLLGAIASGAMLVLALPPSSLWPFGWVALAPVFLATRNTRLGVGVGSAILSSLIAAFIASHGWLYRQGGGSGEPAWIYLGCAQFGFVFAVVAGVSSEIRDRSARSLLLQSAGAVLVETLLLLVMPAPFELSQARVLPMLALASLTGIWGIGFLLWFVNFALAEALRTRRRWLVPIGAWLVLLACGNQFYGRLSSGSNSEGSHWVGVIQTEAVASPELARLSRAAGRSKAELVVWPELSGIDAAPQGDTTRLRQLAAARDMPAFVTSFQDGHRPLPHNTAALFSDAGESEHYFKQKLFGGEVNMHTPGDTAVVVPSPVGPLGLDVCYDSCFPEIFRDTARIGAQVIALPTTDPISPYAFVAANHAAFTPIRAAEEGVSVVRADGAAFSCVADPYGQIVGQIGIGQNRYAAVPIPARAHWTLYRFAGDWFIWLCAAISAWTVGRAILSRRRPPATSKA